MASGIGRAGGAWTLGEISGAKGMVGFKIHGMEVVAANINAVLKQMQLKSTVGLVTAAEFVLTDADTGSPPLVPHGDTGNLRSSRFVEPFTSPNGDPFVVLGYKMNYAAAVHEMLFSASGNPINWNRPGSGPKFLEASLKRNTGNIIAIVGRFTIAGM